MKRTTLLVFCLTTALFAGCNKKSYLDGANVLAYWSEGDAGVRCSQGLDCVAVRDNLLDFDKEVQDRRSEDGMELVRLEAHRSSAGAAFAGVWKKSSDPHEHHEYKAVLNSQQFQAEHAHRSDRRRRQRLVYFTVWKDVADYKIAAIWRPPTESEKNATTWQPDRVDLRLSWAEVDAGLPGYYLDNIEIYPSTIAGDPPFVAAVWRPGTLPTKVLRGDACSISPQPLQATKHGGKNPSCEVTDAPDPSELTDDCPALGQIQAETAGKREGAVALRPSDFEIYVEKGEDRLAVLLQERANKDWLMVPGSWGAVDCRHQLVELDSNLGFSRPPGLLDLDLVGLAAKDLNDVTHEGVIHDGGTSGPPPP